MGAVRRVGKARSPGSYLYVAPRDPDVIFPWVKELVRGWGQFVLEVLEGYDDAGLRLVGIRGRGALCPELFQHPEMTCIEMERRDSFTDALLECHVVAIV